MPDTPESVARINALTTNARNTWFVLLGVLVFVSITLMGVEHIDFYGVDRATQLPLVNVEVPTWLFFYAAPLLITAVYIYFHLYLLRFWDALSIAEPQVGSRPLGDTIAPWLLSDAALYLRVLLRKEPQKPATHRMLDASAMTLNFLLSWVFGLIVLLLIWAQTMPARAIWMTTIAGLCLLASSFAGTASLVMLLKRMRHHGDSTDGHVFKTIPLLISVPVIAPLVLGLGYTRTIGLSKAFVETAAEYGLNLGQSQIDMTGENLVQRPVDWLPHYIARREFRATWCRREQVEDCQLSGSRADEFEDEWNQRRAAQRTALRQPHWSVPNSGPIDLRGANLSGTFLECATLQAALLDGANLLRAHLEAADLDQAQLNGAILTEARMDGVNLSNANMDDANLQAVQLAGAKLTGAQMSRTVLPGARLQSADLQKAVLIDANLQSAQLQNASLSRALLTNANLITANFTNAGLIDADISNAKMSGTFFIGAVLSGANLRHSDLNRARLRRANLDEVDLHDAILIRADLGDASLVRAKLLRTELFGANFERTNLSFSLLAGTESNPMTVVGVDFRGSRNVAGALRHVDLSAAMFDAAMDWRYVFLDASVNVPDVLRELSGTPCQWAGNDGRETPLSDEEFFARWRGWIEADPNYLEWQGWEYLAPEEWQHVNPIPPPDGCSWQSAPFPEVLHDWSD